MAAYYVDSAGSATSPYDTWAKAHTSFVDLYDAVTFTEGDVVRVSHSSADSFSWSAGRTLSNPSAQGVGLKVISTDKSTDQAAIATANQLDSSAGSYNITLSANAYFYGIKVKAGTYIGLYPSAYSRLVFEDCYFTVGHNSQIFPSSVSWLQFIRCTFDIGDTGAATADIFNINNTGITEFEDCTILNGSNRTGSLFSIDYRAAHVIVNGMDISSCTGTGFEIFAQRNNAAGVYIFQHLKLPATMIFYETGGSLSGGLEVVVSNSGNGLAPAQIDHKQTNGVMQEDTSIYRTGGASFNGTNASWSVTTESSCSYARPYRSPWIVVNVDSTGSKNFDIFITHDTTPSADLTDTEVYMELQYKDTSSSDEWVLVDDRPTDIAGAGTAQDDDTTSTWNGTGPSFTYKQRLRNTVTVNTTGIARARVCVCYPSIAAGDYFYIDPKVVVS